MAVGIVGKLLRYTMYPWMYTVLRTGMNKGTAIVASITKKMFAPHCIVEYIETSELVERIRLGATKMILQLFDVIDFLLDAHEAMTKRIDQKKKADKNNNTCSKPLKSNAGIVQDLANIINEDQQEKEARLSEEEASFTVAQTHPPSDTSSENIVTFDQIISNDGDAFDNKSSKFCCQIPGVYIFFYSGIKCGDKEAIWMMQDGLPTDAKPCKNKGDGSSDGDQVSHMAILHLKKGNQVWLQYAKDADIKKDSYTLTTFSGFLLHKQ